jgi:hypothetical protein
LIACIVSIRSMWPFNDNSAALCLIEMIWSFEACVIPFLLNSESASLNISLF